MLKFWGNSKVIHIYGVSQIVCSMRQIMFIDITFNRSLSILMADPQEFLKLSDEQLTAFIIDFEARLQEYLRNRFLMHLVQKHISSMQNLMT